MLRRVTRIVAHLTPAAIVLVWGTLPAFGLEEFRTRETRTFTVGETPEILVEAVNGDVSYTAVTGTTATVDVEVVVRATDSAEADRIREEVKIILDGGDGFLTARVEQPRGFQDWLRHALGSERRIQISFHVHGPAGASGELASVSGDAEADGVSGYLEISTVSGNATARRLSGRTRISSVSGDLSARDCTGPLDAETVSGELILDGCGNELSAHSVSGDIVVRGAPLGIDVETTSGSVNVENAAGTVRAETVSGDITVDQRAGGFDLHTTSGGIRVRSAATDPPLTANSTSGDIGIVIDPAAVGEATLESSSGDIRVDLDMRLRQHGQHRLVGQIGAGTTPLRVSTTSGEIVVGEL